jgi:outer membrane biosynthesis protein TonB
MMSLGDRMHRVKNRFSREFRWVTGTHVVLLAAVLLLPSLRRLFVPDAPALAMPVSVFIETASTLTAPDAPPLQAEPEELTPLPPPDIPEPVPPPLPTPVADEIPEVPTRQEEPKIRPPIKASRVRVTRGTDRPPEPKRPVLSPTDLEARLGADPTTESTNDARYQDIIRRTLYGAWEAPDRDAVGDATATMEIRMAPDGRVISRTLTNRSGNTILDSSVMDAANRVTRISGLSSDFLRRHDYRFMISFQLR